jgi:hypothetical protein
MGQGLPQSVQKEPALPTPGFQTFRLHTMRLNSIFLFKVTKFAMTCCDNPRKQIVR